MTKEDIINYVMNTPTNTNRAVLSSMLDDYNGGGGGSGEMVFTEEFKTSLLNMFEQVLYADGYTRDYYDALEEALFGSNPTILVSISAEFTQGSEVIYDTATLESLEEFLVVTAHYSDETAEDVTNYTLSGTLTAGTSTVTVNYEGLTTTFTVEVTHQSGTYTVTNNLTGCATSNTASAVTENASYSTTITANNGYSLTGATVSVTMDGTDITSTAYNNGTISIASVTGNLVITITAVVVTLSSISAVYTQAGTVYTTDSLNSLKTNLVVTAHYSDSSSAVVTDYTLSGTLTAGTSTITVTYEGKIDTFTVTVTTSQEGVLYQLATPKITDGSTRTDTGVKLADVDKDWSICYDYELTNVPSATTASYSFGNINIGVSEAKARTSSLIYNPSANEATTLSVYMNGIVGNHAIGVITHSVGSKCVKYNIEYTIGGTKYPFTGTTPVQSHDLIVSQVTMQFGATNGTSHKFNRFIINDYVLTNEEITNFMTGGNE